MAGFWNKIIDVFSEENAQKVFAILTYSDSFECLSWDELKGYFSNEATIGKLLDIRVFGPTAEVHKFRDYMGKEWKEVITKDDENPDFYDDYQYLDIDTKRSKEREPGIVCATGGGTYKLPIDKLDNLKVRIRNYVAYDGDGQAYIKAWRLVGFGKGEE